MDLFAHVALDLPLEEHFDYAIPPALQAKAVVGVRVKVTLGTKPMVGFIVGVAEHAAVEKVRPIKSVVDAAPIFNTQDLIFARTFASYYGCSLGEALATMTRHRRNPAPVPTQSHKKNPVITIYHRPDGHYLPIIAQITAASPGTHILVPDTFVANGLKVPRELRPQVGLRSSMFEAFTRCPVIVVVDDDNASYKQEQTPMYEARDVVLMAQRVYGFDACFISASPSIELMHLAASGQAVYHASPAPQQPKPVIIDLGNYKFLDKGMLSPPVRNAMQSNINAGQQSILFLNRRGSFSVTRCADCGYILKCKHCDASMTYLRSKKEFTCRHCGYHVPEAGHCPSCGKMRWKSFGMGVEQLQKELSSLFPTARIVYVEKESQDIPKAFDVLIGTQAMFRYKGKLQARSVVIVDMDSELSRMDMRSSFKGWSLAVHARQMGNDLLVQTRNPDHHVLKAVGRDDAGLFYAEELGLRRELDFPPFSHWVAVIVRSKSEELAQDAAQEVYKAVSAGAASEGVRVLPAQPDIPSKLREQYRFKVMAGGGNVPSMMRLIKNALSTLKRHTKIIITLNVDP